MLQAEHSPPPVDGPLHRDQPRLAPLPDAEHHQGHHHPGRPEGPRRLLSSDVQEARLQPLQEGPPQL